MANDRHIAWRNPADTTTAVERHMPGRGGFNDVELLRVILAGPSVIALYHHRTVPYHSYSMHKQLRKQYYYYFGQKSVFKTADTCKICVYI